MAEQGFVLATAGFPRARPEDLSELAGLFTRVYASLPAPDAGWMPSYMDRVRRGDVTEAESERGRLLLTNGVTRLSAADRLRLQSILEQAIVDGVAERQSAAQRTAEYREIPRTHIAPGPGSSAGSPPAPTRVARATPEPAGDGRRSGPR